MFGAAAPFVCARADAKESVWLSFGGGGGVREHIFACTNKEVLAHAPALRRILCLLESLLCSPACRLGNCVSDFGRGPKARGSPSPRLRKFSFLINVLFNWFLACAADLKIAMWLGEGRAL